MKRIKIVYYLIVLFLPLSIYSQQSSRIDLSNVTEEFQAELISLADTTIALLLKKNEVTDSARYEVIGDFEIALQEQEAVSLDPLTEIAQIPYHTEIVNGAVTYNVPIRTYQPENEGLYPQVSLNYNSLQGYGLAGYGWSIGGVSSITIIPSNYYFDGEAGRAEFLGADATYALDGVRLIKTGITSGQTVYKTETGNITALLNDRSGRYSFDVFYPDGRKAQFGFAEHTTPQPIYPIIQMTDKFSRYIDYKYDKIANNFFIREMVYGRGKQLIGRVYFSYTTRPDITEGYLGGVLIKQSVRLTRIQTCNELRDYYYDYSLIYTYDGTSLLTEIRCVEDKRKKELNPLKFTYKNSSGSGSLKAEQSTLLADFYTSENPDNLYYNKVMFNSHTGREGLICYPKFEFYGVIAQNQVGDQKFGSRYLRDKKILVYTNIAESDYSKKLSPGEGFQKLVGVDINGDGNDQLVQVNFYERNEVGVLSVSIYDQSLKATDQTYTFKDVFQWGFYKSIFPYFFVFGDFIGNGKAQLAAIRGNINPRTEKPHTTDSDITLIDLEKGKIIKTFSFPATNPLKDICFIADVDGDGKSDICVVRENGTNVYSYRNGSFVRTMGHSYLNTKLFDKDENREMLLGDINNDGKMDILISPIKDSSAKEKTTWQIFSGKGDGFAYSAVDLGIDYKEGNKFLLHDMNGDKFPDLLISRKEKLHYILNQYGSIKGTINANNGFNLTAGFYLLPGNIHINQSYRKEEVLTIKDYKITPISFSRNEASERLMLSATDSYGITKYYQYHSLADAKDRSQTSATFSYPYLKVFPVIYPVIGVRTFMNGKIIENKGYDWYDPVFHKQKNSFCAFSTAKETDWQRNHVSKYQYAPTKMGALISVDSPVLEASMDYDFILQSDRRARLLLRKSSQKDKLTGHQTVATYQYDTYSNPVQESVSASDGTSHTINRTYYNNLSMSRYSYIVGLLTSQTAFRESKEGKSAIEMDTYTHDDNYLPVKHAKRFENKSLQPTPASYSSGYSSAYHVKNIPLTEGVALEEEFKYNVYGNPIEHRVKNFSSSTWLSNRYEYDQLGRKVKEIYPLPGLFNEYKYDDQALTVTINDQNGLETCHTYDVWGRLLSTVYPDGTSTLYTAHDAKNEANALYYTQTMTTGKPVSKVWYDAQGRVVKKSSTRFDGKELNTLAEYNDKGLLERESQPYVGNQAKQWTNYSYDSYDRIVQINHFSGDVETYEYKDDYVTVTRNGIPVKTRYNASGEMLSVDDPAGTILYTYHPGGQIKQITAPGSHLTTMEYDLFGRQVSINDPSAGKTIYRYDEAGNMVEELTASGKTTLYAYDEYNRLLKKEIKGEDFTTTYSYDKEDRLKSVAGPNHTLSYSYDKYGRLFSQREDIIDGKWLEKQYSYQSGNVHSVGYSSQSGNIGSENFNYTNGYLTERLLNNSTTIWKLTAENALGLPIAGITGPLSRTYEYDEHGLPTRRTVRYDKQIIQDFTYQFDPVKGNLSSRKDETRSLPREVFQYDQLNRLTHFGGNSIQYEKNGNIRQHSGVGLYEYAEQRPYAVENVSLLNPVTPSSSQKIKYNAMRRPTHIAENKLNAIFAYGNDNQRVKMVIAEDDSPVLTRYYLSNYEIEQGQNGDVERFYLGGDAYSASAVYIKENGIWNIHYICRDYLGSITHLVDATGAIREELSYDAWGRLRNPQTRQLYATNEIPGLLLGRGYTGHEHLPMFGLINMNARLYDPVLGRFLSPDPYVQNPLYSQNFNRYSYCMNNPLVFTDPDGELAWFVIPLAVAVVGGTMNVAANWKNIDGFWQGFTSFMVGAGAGFATAATGGAGASVWAVSGVAAASGTITAANNSIVEQTGHNFSGFDQVDWKDVGINSAAGGVSGFAGGVFGHYGGQYLGNIVVNGTKIGSPILQSSIKQGIGGSLGGYTGGFASGLILTGDLGRAHSLGVSGFTIGLGTGLASGATSGYLSAKKNNLNPWTGKKLGIEIVGSTHTEVLPTQYEIYEESVEFYKNELRNNRPVPDITGYEVNGRIYIEDGHHRYVSYKSLGIEPKIYIHKYGGPIGLPDWSGTIYCK